VGNIEFQPAAGQFGFAEFAGTNLNGSGIALVVISNQQA
jgi:hypothetical protein